jgi:methionyl-tRNA synthetase
MSERYIVTNAFPYINRAKYLGNLVRTLSPADIYAHYLRMKGEGVIAIRRADESRPIAEVSALEERDKVRVRS